jgi:hypothetical protein
VLEYNEGRKEVPHEMVFRARAEGVVLIWPGVVDAEAHGHDDLVEAEDELRRAKRA